MQNTCRYVTRELVQVVIYDYLQDNSIENPFTGGVPGKDWWQRFMKQSPSLSERKPQHLTKKRAQERDGEIIRTWFDKVEEVLSTTAWIWTVRKQHFARLSHPKSWLYTREESGTHHCSVCWQWLLGEASTIYSVQGKNLYRRWMKGDPAAAIPNQTGWMPVTF